MKRQSMIVALLCLPGLLAGCDSLREKPDLSTGHVQEAGPVVEKTDIPAPVKITPIVPEPAPPGTDITHTVVVYDVPVKELLFSLARDSDLNLDIDPDIDATITINAVDQPLVPLLERIADSTDLRYELQDNLLRVRRDTPFMRNYRLDSLNMARRSSANVAVATQIQSTGSGAGGDSSSTNVGNSSDTLVQINSDYDFWATLYGNIDSLLSDGVVDEGALEEAGNPNIVMNRESGVLGVRATKRQHAEIQRFLDTVENSIGKQVLIEATIAEVQLSDSYQAGIDWSLLQAEGNSGVNLDQSIVNESLQSPPNFVFNITNFNGSDVLSATLTALETFGDVSVMSSPKVMAMNNQTAVLKVVDNLVYFTLEVNIDSSSTTIGEGRLTTFETEIFTVPVGFVMTVTPFVDEENEVILNVRPTISRVIDYVQDPNPALAEADVVSEIPVIQVREVESVLKVASGNIAVIGGLMQDEIQRNSTGVPLLGSLPMLGSAFRYDDDSTKKSELVIFIQPRVISNASLQGDLQDYRRYLPVAPPR
ncbi:MAG: secretin N-terminal domain-containing protein [Halieaceae bacterium]